MRAVTSLVRSWLVGIGVFAAMTLSLCVALSIAVAGPPTRSEIADLRALIAETLRALGPAGGGEAAPAPVERTDADRAPAAPASPAPERPQARRDGPLLGGPQAARPAAPPSRPHAPSRQTEPARVRQEPSAPPPTPATESRAAQIARDAEELLATAPPPADQDAEASDAADPWAEPSKEEVPQSYEEWAESWTPFEAPEKAP